MMGMRGCMRLRCDLLLLLRASGISTIRDLRRRVGRSPSRRWWRSAMMMSTRCRRRKRGRSRMVRVVCGRVLLRLWVWLEGLEGPFQLFCRDAEYALTLPTSSSVKVGSPSSPCLTFHFSFRRLFLRSSMLNSSDISLGSFSNVFSSLSLLYVRAYMYNQDPQLLPRTSYFCKSHFPLAFLSFRVQYCVYLTSSYLAHFIVVSNGLYFSHVL
ncbi:hypothetical protein GALMADRAFT_771275 [Galerina marginata CBS 339.88]|uniref:Secreted protein n=1 Tax=Galerina marginata (strain CBS 339.88) TaxID=685588 RepID=A0A067SND9_GALM3|nr:hypothetical protein GALMADRAFT_771275 [Galerina marginata CBS 339.88]